MNEGHNALAINDSTPPDFVNEIGVKWWQLNIGKKKDGTAFLVDKNGDQEYVLIRDGQPVRATKNFEQLCYYFTELELVRKHRVGYKPRKKRQS